MKTQTGKQAIRNYRAVDFGSAGMRIKDLAAGIARRRRMIAKLQREIAASERFIALEKGAAR